MRKVKNTDDTLKWEGNLFWFK